MVAAVCAFILRMECPDKAADASYIIGRTHHFTKIVGKFYTFFVILTVSKNRSIYYGYEAASQ